MSYQHEHDHTEPPEEIVLRVKALESLLLEKGMIDLAALDQLVDTYEHKVGPRNGAQVVAKAWADPAYKARLLADGTKAIAELGFSGVQGEDMVVVENTAAYITYSSVPCAPATPGRCWVCRRYGSSPRRTVRALSLSHVRCWPNSV